MEREWDTQNMYKYDGQKFSQNFRSYVFMFQKILLNLNSINIFCMAIAGNIDFYEVYFDINIASIDVVDQYFRI